MSMRDLLINIACAWRGAKEEERQIDMAKAKARSQRGK